MPGLATYASPVVEFFAPVTLLFTASDLFRRQQPFDRAPGMSSQLRLCAVSDIAVCLNNFNGDVDSSKFFFPAP